jgi:hypothetical protein
MKPIKTILALILVLGWTVGCEMETISPLKEISDLDMQFDLEKSHAKQLDLLKATGSVQILWKGGPKGKSPDMGNQPEERLAFFDFNAHEGFMDIPPKGEIVFWVAKLDSTVTREIKAEVTGVHIDPLNMKGYIVATVVSDTKGCGGDGQGGHSGGCSDSHDDGGCGGEDGTTHDDGGCSHDDTGGDDGTTHDDGGCSHDDTGGTDTGGTDTGGCSHDTGTTDTTHDEGGCSGSDTGDSGDSHDGGCSHDTGDDTSHDEGGCAGGSGGSADHGMGGSDMGNPLSGKNCRTGQVIVIKVHDKVTSGIDDPATPENEGDGISWKWFSADNAPLIENYAEWTHLCKKTIVEGNLVVHVN